MKKFYYLEICDSAAISGGVYPLGEMTEKQALKETERRIKELWRNDKKSFRSIRFNLCTDEDAFDMVYYVSLFEGDITVYDYRTEKIIKDTQQDRINRLNKEINESLECCHDLINKMIGINK